METRRRGRAHGSKQKKTLSRQCLSHYKERAFSSAKLGWLYVCISFIRAVSMGLSSSELAQQALAQFVFAPALPRWSYFFVANT
ncbi:hypothetical protein [Porphyromonas gingivicanis]|uniref:hypothetical protein n=1 Tax=Porphyromonas gingivicanis TaxID=266762 RepID=UPI00131ED921|nr:hypothetical protein [Porphyromonas gingivicanis]